LAAITLASILSLVSSIFPLLAAKSPITSPKKLEGITTSNFIIGSNKTGLAFLEAS